ncbi:efflux RND transporter periplasmic adaptor subunit [Methylophaga sp.]|uniref:efflux RND transporter periplasmic adaptor subunit n=1 Tax=Methylophaga sp. TaxID=2024840 RepID=UPI003F6A4771
MKLLTLFLLYVGFAQSAPLTLSQAQQQNLGVTFFEAEQVSTLATQPYPAQVSIPNTSRVIVHSALGGVVKTMLKAEGDPVEKGELMADINSPQLIQLQSDYLQNLTSLQQAESELQRDKLLFDEGIIAERRYHDTHIQAQQARNKLDAVAKHLSIIGMTPHAINNLKRERQLTSSVNVLAPQNGVVMRQSAVAGKRINASDTLYEIADLSRLWLEIHVPLNIASSISPGQTVKVCDRDVEANVLVVGRQVHDIDQGVLVRAQANANTDKLTPGEVISVCFIEATSAQLYKLPYSALLRLNNQQPYIFVSTDKGVDLLAVEIISTDDETVIVKVNKQTLGQVVTEGVSSLKAAWLAENGE